MVNFASIAFIVSVLSVNSANYVPQLPANAVPPDSVATTTSMIGYTPPKPNSSTGSPNFLTPFSIQTPKVVTCQSTSLKIAPAAATPSIVPSSVSVPKAVNYESTLTQTAAAIGPSTTKSTAAYIPPKPISSTWTCFSVLVPKVITCESTPSKIAPAAALPPTIPSSVSVPKVVSCEPTSALTFSQPVPAAVTPAPTCPRQSISTVFKTIPITKTVESTLTITQSSTLMKTVSVAIVTTVTETVTKPKKCKRKTTSLSSESTTPIYAPPTPPTTVQVKPVQQTNYIAPTPLSYVTTAATLKYVAPPPFSAPAAQTATKTPLYVPAMAGKKREIPKATDVTGSTRSDFVATRTDGETATTGTQKKKREYTVKTRIIPTVG
ncbi:UNVERIFIED_CONTAM: hypothetical protein HDU68_011165 [Siphonaria sp. JEL0065]|nr:hypothetical protein HDU68_011165 [Siphonaria sp. JEL0065]